MYEQHNFERKKGMCAFGAKLRKYERTREDILSPMKKRGPPQWNEKIRVRR